MSLDNYSIGCDFSREEMQQISRGEVPDKLLSKVKAILDTPEDTIFYFFLVYIREGGDHYEACASVPQVLIDGSEPYTLDQISDAVQIDWFRGDDYDSSCLDARVGPQYRDEFCFDTDNGPVWVRSDGTPRRINQHQFEALTHSVFAVSEIDLQRGINYRLGKEPCYWHPGYMPIIHSPHDVSDNPRYVRVDFLDESLGEIRVLLVPFVDVVWDLYEADNQELIKSLEKIWDKFKKSTYQHPKFTVDKLYDAFGDETKND